MKKHSGALRVILSAASPETLAYHFEADGLISLSVLDELKATGLSSLKIAGKLIDEIQRNMSGINVVEKFNKLCKILKENGNLATKGIVMMLEREVGLIPEK